MQTKSSSALEKLEQMTEKLGPVEVARMLGVTYRTIWRWRKEKSLPSGASVSVSLLWKSLNG